MKLICEIEIPNDDRYTVLDAMAQASRDQSKWRIVRSREELMPKTDLDGKCGSCIYYNPIHKLTGMTCYGKCMKGLSVRQRTTKACKRYESEA